MAAGALHWCFSKALGPWAWPQSRWFPWTRWSLPGVECGVDVRGGAPQACIAHGARWRSEGHCGGLEVGMQGAKHHAQLPFMVGGQSTPAQEETSEPGGFLNHRGEGKRQRLRQRRSGQKNATKNRSLKVCFAYNKSKGCSRKDCPFAHICSRCRGQHPYYKCSEVKRPPSSAGNYE